MARGLPSAEPAAPEDRRLLAAGRPRVGGADGRADLTSTRNPEQVSRPRRRWWGQSQVAAAPDGEAGVEVDVRGDRGAERARRRRGVLRAVAWRDEAQVALARFGEADTGRHLRAEHDQSGGCPGACCRWRANAVASEPVRPCGTWRWRRRGCASRRRERRTSRVEGRSATPRRSTRAVFRGGLRDTAPASFRTPRVGARLFGGETGATRGRYILRRMCAETVIETG